MKKILFLVMTFVGLSLSAATRSDLAVELAGVKRAKKGLGLFSLPQKFALAAREADLKHTLFPKSRLESPTRSFCGSFALVVSAIPLVFWQLLFLFFWILLLASLFLKCKLGFVKNKRVPLLLVFVAGVLLYVSSQEHQKIAVIVARSAEVRSGPGNDYPSIGRFVTGQEAVVLEEEGLFAKVDDGEVLGWVSVEACERS